MPQTLDLSDILREEELACAISDKYLRWENLREKKMADWREIQQYIFATSTRDTTNKSLDWSNTTVLPKLCQIRDNLHANYMAAMFPSRRWLTWEGARQEDETINKVAAIEAYTNWMVDRSEFYSEVSKLVYDYIDYGNTFATVEWQDNMIVPNNPSSTSVQDQTKYGYVGPSLRRIAPTDIVFDPTAKTFMSAPKVVRSIVSMGEARKIIEKESEVQAERDDAQDLYNYLLEIRKNVISHPGSLVNVDDIYNVSGFGSYREYLSSSSVEILTFYGDIFLVESGEFYENYVIKVIDRHRILSKRVIPSFFGHAPIYHVGWRLRPDNLWAMGPLDNLVGMQYRIDHLENMKADIWDLTAYPPVKVQGYVPEFKWGPMERIDVGEDGDINLLSPDVGALQANIDIAFLEQKMEEMAGSPREAAGFRTPGEKTAYEVQRLENAASRIFQSKIMQFERDGTENWINAMLELARRNLTPTSIRIFDDAIGVAAFRSVSQADIAGMGRIKPIAARHFAEKAQQVQNLNNFFASPVGMDQTIRQHFSSIGLATLFEDLLDIEGYDIVSPFVLLGEQADSQRMANSLTEQVAMETQTPGGIFAGDTDPELG